MTSDGPQAAFEASTDSSRWMPTAPPSPLDDLWAEAESLLPKHWRFGMTPYWPSGWEAEAHDLRYPSTGRGPHGTGAFFGETPVKALRCLVARLGLVG